MTDQVVELVSTIRSEKFLEQLALALPEGVTPQRFARITITALQANPDIAELDRDSVLRSLLQAAGTGLMPDGREAALVPFKGKATFMPMVTGYRKIAAEHGIAIEATVVCANDEFEYEAGLEPKLRHVHARPGVDRGDRVAVYAIGRLPGGRAMTRVLYAADVEKRRRVSRQADGEGWSKWPDQMWEKTAVRDLFQDLPLGERNQDEPVARLLAAGDAAAALYGAPFIDAEADEIAAHSREPAANGAGDADRPTVSASLVPPSEPEPGGDLGDTVVEIGKHAGKTLAQIAAEPKGESWIGWCIKADGHPQQKAVLEFAHENLPQVYEQALTELSVA